MGVKPGYKQTEIGVIPEDWEVKPLSEGIKLLSGHHVLARHCNTDGDGFPYITGPADFPNGVIQHTKYTTSPKTICRANDILVTVKGSGAGTLVLSDAEYCISRQLMATWVNNNWDTSYIYFSLLQKASLFNAAATGLIPGLSRSDILDKTLPLPPTLAEQTAIATALSDADALIQSLERLIAKKRDIKQGAMQELLTGKKRLPGFETKKGCKRTEVGAIPEDWGVKTLYETTDCLDNLRIPLNGSQRLKRRGEIPYCGANGILDYIDDYVIDDNIILMAEDGGYFDEYLTRPIAYCMIGKCWVNNHVHILKAKKGVEQGFIFYSIVHKNILRYLASGTRAKLNRSELNKIEIGLPDKKQEQSAIATVLSDMDAEIATLDSKLAKAHQIKQGMMQELLTGRIRLS